MSYIPAVAERVPSGVVREFANVNRAGTGTGTAVSLDSSVGGTDDDGGGGVVIPFDPGGNGVSGGATAGVVEVDSGDVAITSCFRFGLVD